MNTAFEPEPLWVTAVWLALSYVVVWLAFRLPPVRAFLATVGMVITSTVIVIASEPILPISIAPWLTLLLQVSVQTAVEAAVLVWGFRAAWSRRFALLFVANVIALFLSVSTAISSEVERAVRAQMVPVGASRAEALEKASGPNLERPFDAYSDVCPVGTVRALEYYAPTGANLRLWWIENRGSWGGSVTTICLDANDRVVSTEMTVG